MRGLPAPLTAAGDDLSPGIRGRFAALKGWGLGWGEEAEGYRRRLRDLCRFLQEVRGGAEGPADGDSARIRSAVERVKRGSGDPQREARLRRLEDLAPALRGLVDARGHLREQAGRDAVRACLGRLAAWSLRPRPGETQADFDSRCDSLKRPLELVGALAVADAGPPERPLDHLLALVEELDALPAGTPPDRLDLAWKRLRERLEDCLADWDWAYVQVRVEMARLYAEEAPPGTGGRAPLARAYTCLADALARLERDGFRQPRTQGLYGLMARVCLHRVAAGEDPPALLQEALGHAYRGVELDPESARERLALVEALAALGDYDTMKVEAEVARNLDPGPETLQVIGASFWQRSATLRDRKARQRVLGEAAEFFEAALGHLESASFDHEAPMRLMDAHGWAHFWLGRFQMERARHDEAIAHLRIACRLGFKPLESRVELAWACLLARDSRQAERAFAEAAAEIQRWRTGVRVAPALGEEREIDELDFDAHLGWALLSADWAPARFEERHQAARQLFQLVARPDKGDLEAALREAQGRAHFRAGRFPECIAELEQAIATSARAGAYCYLGLAETEVARAAEGKERADALRRAARDRDLAREIDVRERYQREIDELDAAVQKLQPKPPPREAAPPPGDAGDAGDAPGGAAPPGTAEGPPADPGAPGAGGGEPAAGTGAETPVAPPATRVRRQ